MFKLWAKQFDENQKIIKNQTFEFKQEFDARLLGAYMQVICNEWKTETPIILKNHIISFDYFNHIKFNKTDFVDEVEFYYLTVQLIS